jgi:4-hydroxythreonine-4-phosphate dehydrogenase
MVPVIIADPDLLSERASQLDLSIDIKSFAAFNPDQPALWVDSLKLAEAAEPGKLNQRNAPYVLAALDRAVEGCLSGKFHAMVTGPVQKSIINDAGITFSGHTEYLAEHCHCEQVVMMLVIDDLRVALATTHLPLAEVPTAISQATLAQAISILHRDLQNKFGIASPRILVCGLNPHAGEGGHLGREEIDIIIPLIEKLKAQGLRLKGPLPADTVFTPKYLENADVVLAMYHDQGLPVLKSKGFGEAVNITLGLPIIRCSVDHGTALDLAGTGKASFGSLMQAFKLAAGMQVRT